MGIRLLICITLSHVLLQSVTSATWDYKGNGPATWGENFKKCNGDSQSPIDVDTFSVDFDDDLPAVDRNIFYNPPAGMTVSNNGHSIVVTFQDGYSITDSKLLPFRAKVAQYHFHWGTATETSFTEGSEHTIDGKQYFGEFHIVHYNEKYANLSEAVPKSDGLAVFGWFIDVTYPQTNLDIKNLLDIAKNQAEMKDDSGDIAERFSVETLIPPDISEYYRYKGSLTTPTCDESVVWTLFRKPIEITQAQAYALAAGFFETATNEIVLVNNFRPPQPLNGRKVTKSRPLVQSGSAAFKPHFIVGLLSLMMSIICLH